jgi:hypothetical protein
VQAKYSKLAKYRGAWASTLANGPTLDHSHYIKVHLVTCHPFEHFTMDSNLTKRNLHILYHMQTVAQTFWIM